MRIGPEDRMWVVTDPTSQSELADICFEASLADLHLQFKGGLTMASNPTLFTDRGEAEVEALGRLVARDASRAIAAQAAEGKPLKGAHRIEVLDENGKVLLESNLN